jgi:hypothetical protein
MQGRRVVRRSSWRGRCERWVRSREFGLVAALIAGALIFAL